MIAAWRVCADCPTKFGLTPRQCHAGLRAQTRRCAACRAARRRRLAAIRGREFRLRRRNAKSAPIRTVTPSTAASDARRAA